MSRQGPPPELFTPDVPSPCFVLDERRLIENAAILANVQEATGAKILLALKGFSAWSMFPLLSRAKNGPLWGACASSVDEARLGREEFGGEVHAYAAAWSQQEIEELATLADHIVFNSISQLLKYLPVIRQANQTFRKSSPIKSGLRVNPEHSEGAVAIYNPCAPGSRLGIRKKDFPDPENPALKEVSGLHFHTLCEQNSDALKRTLNAFEEKFGTYIKNCAWINFGGGHHITRPDYDLDLLKETILGFRQRHNVQVYLEPGEAVALNAGWLTATVLDIVEADLPVAILDVSASCHMPDVMEMPYTPPVWRLAASWPLPEEAKKPGEDKWTCRLAGKSCLAGDVIGAYSFGSPLRIGQRLVFGDMAIYSMVKTTTFNGLRLPSIGVYGVAEPKFRMLREFSYADFKGRLS